MAACTASISVSPRCVPHGSRISTMYRFEAEIGYPRLRQRFMGSGPVTFYYILASRTSEQAALDRPLRRVLGLYNP